MTTITSPGLPEPVEDAPETGAGWGVPSLGESMARLDLETRREISTSDILSAIDASRR